LEKIYKYNCERLRSYIQENQLRSTHERFVILRCICERREAFSPKDLCDWLTNENISQATIYNTLSLLVKARILQGIRRHPNSKQIYYELLEGENNHMQIICAKCGKVLKVKDAVIRDAILAKKIANFQAQRFSLYIYGECKVCRRPKINNKKNSVI
jgi:Fe2+ or Zn2+ uptake regulation protein